MTNIQQEIDARTSLTANNQFELFLFRLGTSENSDQQDLFGINVFKVRELMEMPTITEVAGCHPHMMGIANIRGQIVPVINLPAAVGRKATSLRILLVTEFARSTQAFAVADVVEIVRLDWSKVLSAETSVGGGLITSIARIERNDEETRLAQVLDVEQILRNVMPSTAPDIEPDSITAITMHPGSIILAADDSALARSLIEQGLHAMGVPFTMTKTGKQAWDKLQIIADEALAEGITVKDKVALVLTDLEMPEMDGFTLTRNIKADARFAGIPVVIHSSLTGTANEDHVKSAGADAYVAKFDAIELAKIIRKTLAM